MAKRRYGQFCGIARALEIVGERWAMLIVRDLLGGSKRYTDLRKGLRTIPTNVLASRLKEMEESGIVQRAVLPRPATGVAYELTPYGRELEDILLRLGRWGAKSLPAPDEGPGYVDPAIRALRASFRPDAAGDLAATFELQFGAFAIHADVRDGRAVVDEGAADHPDLTIDARGSIIPVLTGEIIIDDALDSDRIRYRGRRELLERFVKIFRMPADRSKAP